MEAAVLPFIMEDFCVGPRDLDTGKAIAFDARVKVCQKKAQTVNLLKKNKGLEDARDLLYCRCWCAAFDSFDIVSTWAAVAWIGLLFGIMSVLYITVQPELAQMTPRERNEVLAFACVGMALLSFKASNIAEDVPWGKDSAGKAVM
eukprot:TRINITY_DN33123_c0_g1_i1.p1 TRINITY_DN33123_c0_g1~~TRINITY_DN33123_c0_g1_i1.p1  ORF type:complete len:146 (+),score=29.19 TRINITY_DN33123_c0_g1_i1:197-634(+)